LLRFLGAKRFGLTVDRSHAGGSPAGNLVVFAYDWRLSNRFSAECLKCRVEAALLRWRASAPPRREAKVVFICHSMGGLVARWYLDRLGGAEIARVLVTLGTPHRGAVKTVDQLVNGVRKGPGPLKLDLTRFARSLPSSYQLLPEYACITAGAGELKKTTEVELPAIDGEMVADGMRFHDELDASGARSYPLVPVVGIGQPTPTSVGLDDDRVVMSTTFDGADRGGDGTVARLAARPKGMPETDPVIRGVGEGHGLLAAHRSVTDQLDLVLTAEDVAYRAAQASDENVIGVSVPDLHEHGEAIAVSVSFPSERTLEVLAVDEAGREAGWARVRYRGETDPESRPLGGATLDGIGPGGYTILVRAPDDPRGIDVAPVRSTTLVLG
jgi:pimeloyl-ACP methyl ester carboxylesterase